MRYIYRQFLSIVFLAASSQLTACTTQHSETQSVQKEQVYTDTGSVSTVTTTETQEPAGTLPQMPPPRSPAVTSTTQDTYHDSDPSRVRVDAPFVHVDVNEHGDSVNVQSPFLRMHKHGSGDKLHIRVPAIHIDAE